MAVLEVPCPNCGAKLKAPESVAGKKVKCKKCGASFVAPGGDPKAQPVGESQMLSAMESPVPKPPPPPSADDLFNFGAMITEAVAESPKPKSKSVAKAPAAAAPPPPAAAKKPAAKSTPQAAVAPPADTFAVNDSRPDAPVPDVLSIDDDEQLPAVAAADPGNAFAFPSGPDTGEPGGLVHSKPTLEEAPRRGGRHYHGKSQPAGGGGKGLKILAVVSLLAVGGGIGAAVVLLTKKKEPEAAAKKDPDPPKKDDPPPPEAAKDDAKEKKGKDKKDGTKGATAKGTTPGKDAKDVAKEPPKEVPVVLGPGGAAVDPGPVGATLTLPANLTFQTKKVDAKPTPVQKPASDWQLDAAYSAVRRVFPPNKPSDGGVVWQSGSGFQGKGERLTLDLYSPDGKRRDRIEFDGDGRPEPVCDLSEKGDFFAHVLDGKLTVWKVQDKTKVLDALDVYADKPDHKKAGVGAVFFAADPKQVVTVSTAGAVHLWDVAAKTASGEFAPPKGTPGRVAQGKGAAVTPERDSVVVAVGGTVTRVVVKDKLDPQPPAELGGDVGRSLGIGMAAGRVVYAFETADKKARAVVFVAPDGGTKFWQLPKEAEPVSAGWADEQMAVVGLANGGAAWFMFDNGSFMPVGLLQAAAAKGTHAAGAKAHWYLTASPSVPTKTAMVELTMPPDGVIDYRMLFEEGKRTQEFKLDTAGLSK